MREAVAQKNQLCVGGKLVAGAGLGHTMHRPRNQARGTPSKGLETQGSSDKSTGWLEAVEAGWKPVAGGGRWLVEGGRQVQVAGWLGKPGGWEAGGWRSWLEVAGGRWQGRGSCGRWLEGKWLEVGGWRRVAAGGR